MEILLVDDDTEDHEIFIEAVKTINDQIVCTPVKSAREALNFLKQTSAFPDFIFLDVNMPQVDGKTFLKELKSIPGLRTIPIIIYSTTQDKEEINVLRYLGAGYIHKTASFKGLVASLSKYLK